MGKVSYVKRITYSTFLTAYFYYLIGITAPGNTVFYNELNTNVLMTFVVKHITARNIHWFFLLDLYKPGTLELTMAFAKT